MFTEDYEEDIGECCFCGRECNALSQSCGMCSRTLSGYAAGITPFPKHMANIYSFSLREIDESEDENGNIKCVCGSNTDDKYGEFCCKCWQDLFQFSSGLRKLPVWLEHLADDYKNKVCVHYTGIGSGEKGRELFYEDEFRKIMFENKDNFLKTCSLDPNICDIGELIKWSGAKKVYHGLLL